MEVVKTDYFVQFTNLLYILITCIYVAASLLTYLFPLHPYSTPRKH